MLLTIPFIDCKYVTASGFSHQSCQHIEFTVGCNDVMERTSKKLGIVIMYLAPVTITSFKNSSDDIRPWDPRGELRAKTTLDPFYYH